MADDEQTEPSATIPLANVAYEVAYRTMPGMAFENFEIFAELCDDGPLPNAGPAFYIMACRDRGTARLPQDAFRFKLHRGSLREGVEYYALEYPPPTPVDLTGRSLSESRDAVLAPYFSVVVHEAAFGRTSYFVLGQAPMGGGTTLRRLTAEPSNANLGPGPAPQIDAFLDAVRDRLVSAG